MSVSSGKRYFRWQCPFVLLSGALSCDLNWYINECQCPLNHVLRMTPGPVHRRSWLRLCWRVSAAVAMRHDC